VTHSRRTLLCWTVGILGVAWSPGLASAQATPSPPPAASVDAPAEATPTDTAPAPSNEDMAALRAALERLTTEVDALRAEQNSRQEDEAVAEAAALADLMESAEVAAVPEGFEPNLHLYGWSELGLQRAWGGLSSTGLVGADGATFLSRTNLYIDAYPAPNARVLTEIRLGLFPDGARDLNYNPINTTVTDLNSPYGGLALTKWSGIVLERAHADWTPSDAFNLRGGLFLTPYGIWNVDHGAPTRITLSPPAFISFGLLPERQLGVEAFGTFAVLPWTLGYHLYVSNGRTFSATARNSVANDPTDNKAVGGRFFARTRRPYPMTFGVSGYTGYYDAFSSQLTIRPDRVESVSTHIVEMREHAVAADVSVDLGKLRLRSEGVLRWVYYGQGRRELAGVSAYTADMLQFGAYLMAAYELPWYRIEPLAMIEVMRVPTILGEGALVYTFGLNFYLSPTMTIRTQYFYAQMVDFSGPPRDLVQSYNHFLNARFIASF